MRYGKYVMFDYSSKEKQEDGSYETTSYSYYKPDDTLEQLQAKVSDCYKLCARINSYKITRSYSNNFLTDLIHLAAYYCCLSKSRDHWISDMSREFTNKRNIIVGGERV